MIKDEGPALLLCCGFEPAQRRITAFSRPREHMWLVQHMDWVTPLVFFFFFFPFPERGYMAVCSWNKDRTPPCWHAAWFLNPPLSFSFLGRKIVSSPTWNSSGPHPWPPTLHHVPSIAFFPGVGGWWGGNSFIIALFSLKHEPPLPCFFFFYFRPAPVSWNSPQKHVPGFELSPLFPKLIATFRLARALWSCERVHFGFFYCAIIPQVPQRPGDDTWRIYDKLETSNLGQDDVCGACFSGIYFCVWAGKFD